MLALHGLLLNEEPFLFAWPFAPPKRVSNKPKEYLLEPTGGNDMPDPEDVSRLVVLQVDAFCHFVRVGGRMVLTHDKCLFFRGIHFLKRFVN